MEEKLKELWKQIGMRYKSHPWHGVDIGENAPDQIMAFIEVVPTDTIKYEVDKETGYLMIDRPQKFSNIMPALYGFVPRTYCDKEVAALCNERTGRDNIVGDGDPLDICVLTEREVTHGDILVNAIPIGGMRMIDDGEADDKIVAVLKDDLVYGGYTDIKEVPHKVIERLRHYFLTYKSIPGATEGHKFVEITEVYGAEDAKEVIRRSIADYKANYGNIESHMARKARATIGRMD